MYSVYRGCGVCRENKYTFFAYLFGSMKRKRLYLSQQQQTTKTLTTMTTTIRLQSIGLVPATPAQNIKVGSKLLWNFGYTSEVIEIVKTTAHTITIATKEASGTTYTRRLNKTRLVAIVK